MCAFCDTALQRNYLFEYMLRTHGFKKSFVSLNTTSLNLKTITQLHGMEVRPGRIYLIKMAPTPYNVIGKAHAQKIANAFFIRPLSP